MNVTKVREDKTYTLSITLSEEDVDNLRDNMDAMASKFSFGTVEGLVASIINQVRPKVKR